MVDAAGTTRYAYNSVGLLTLEDGPWDNDAVSFGYTNTLRSTMSVQAATGGAETTFAYTYDTMGRLSTVSGPAGLSTYSYRPDPSALVSKILYSNGAYITNSYTNTMLLAETALKNSGGTVLNSHSYYRAGKPRIEHMERNTGSRLEYEYDGAGQLAAAKGSEGATPRSHERFGYKYDAAGNLQNKTNNQLIQSFEVNSLNQITNFSRQGYLTAAAMAWGTPTSASLNGSAATLYADDTFAADFSYNDGTNSYSAQVSDATGRTAEDSVTVVHPATLTFKYDQNGNLLTDGVRHFTYDDENQLTQVVVTNVTKSEFTYDTKMRRRIRKESVWVAGTWQFIQEARYVYDDLLVTQERHYDPRLATATPIQLVTYTRGTDLSGSLQDAGGIGSLLARTESNSGSLQSAYYHCDNVGNITMLIDTNQSVVARYFYEPFGSVIASSGPLADANLYRFSSKEAHEQSGLVYYLYRYYEPRLQRWLNRDPIRETGGINLYTAVANNPIQGVDGFGLILMPCAAAKIALEAANEAWSLYEERFPDRVPPLEYGKAIKLAQDAVKKFCPDPPPPPPLKIKEPVLCPIPFPNSFRDKNVVPPEYRFAPPKPDPVFTGIIVVGGVVIGIILTTPIGTPAPGPL